MAADLSGRITACTFWTNGLRRPATSQHAQMDAEGTILVMLALCNAGYPRHRSSQPSYVPPGLAGII